MSDFDVCASQAKKQTLPVAVVKKHYDEFLELDLDRNGSLTPAEFEVAVRKLCHVPEDEPTPSHLFDKLWKILDKEERGFARFEEFLLWSLNVAFTQEVMVDDQGERSIRNMAKKHNLNLLDVERMRGIFAKFDVDKSGEVDMEEFKQILCHVMKVKESSDISNVTVQRYFREVDIDGSGDIDFEEFVTWYLTVHDKKNKHNR